MLRVKKLTCKEKKWTVIAEQSNGKDWDEVQFTSADEPKPALLAALAALREPVLDILEMPPDSNELQRVTVTGVTFSYTDAGIMGATLVARRSLFGRNAPMNLITPHLFEEYTSGSDDGDPKQLLPHECRQILYTLQEEALDYLAGKRSQLSLFPADAIPDNAETEGESVTLDFAEGPITVTVDRLEKILPFMERILTMSDRDLQRCVEKAHATHNTMLVSILARECDRRGLLIPVAA
jgi:hypothetical protein